MNHNQVELMLQHAAVKW